MQQFSAQLKQAIKIAWLVLTAGSILGLLPVLLLPAESLLALGEFLRVPHPWCPLCGMTRALLALREGELALSMTFNPAACPLAAAWFANVLAALTQCRLRSRRPGNRSGDDIVNQ